MYLVENIAPPMAAQSPSVTDARAPMLNASASLDFSDIALNVVGLPVVDTWDQVDGLVRVLMGLPDAAAGAGGGVPWYAGFRGVDLATGAALPENWGGTRGAAGMARWFGGGPKDADLYWAIAPMGAGETRRSAGGAVSQSVLIADDIGTKVDVALWEQRFARGCPRPTLEIETSPGNRTFVWALDGVGSDPARWADLALIRAWMIEDGLTDAVMDVCRYVRLPCGWNSKQKYKAAWVGGRPPGVRAVAWRPGRVSLEALGDTLVPGATGPWRARGEPTGSGARSTLTGGQLMSGALVRSADLGSPDALMGLGVRLGMDLAQGGPGVVTALCPNRAKHTVRAETGFAFLGGGLMHCNHASCQSLSTRDFRAMMLAEYAADANAGAGEPARGEDWLAAEEMRLAGLLSASGVAAAQAEGDRLAGARAVRQAAQQAAFTQDLAGLVARFVWVRGQNAFLDTVTRTVIPDRDFDAHPAVLAVIAVGATGQNRARNQVLNHPDLIWAENLTRAVGKQDAVVREEDATGRETVMANTWVGSVWHGQDKARKPVEWLELVAYVIPDAAYREWFIKWLAWGFQFPDQRRMTIPLLVGGQGVGKDAMLIPIRKLMGPHNVQDVSMGQLKGQFTGWMLSDLVILPELKLSSDGSMYNQIKGWLANKEDRATINEKYRAPYPVRARYSMLSMSNHMDGLKGLEPDDRRWQIYVTPAVKADKAFYDRVIEGAKTDASMCGLLHYLLHEVDLKGFDVYTPAPGSGIYRGQMLAENLTGVAQWVHQSFQPGEAFAVRQLVTIAELQISAQASPSCTPKSAITSRGVRDGLLALEWANIGQVRHGQHRASLWVSPKLAAAPGFNDMKEADLLARHAREVQAGADLAEQALLGLQNSE